MLVQLKYDIRIIKSSRYFKYVLLGLTCIAALSVYYTYYMAAQYSGYLNNNGKVYSYFLMDIYYGSPFYNVLRSETVLYYFIIPLIIPFAFSDILYNDIEIRMYTKIRNDKAYYISKFLVLSLVSFLLVFYFFMAMFLFHICLLGIKHNDIFYAGRYALYNEIHGSSLFRNLLFNHMALYNLVRIIMFCFYALMCAIIYFICCLFINNKNVSLMIPFLIFVVGPHVFSFILGESFEGYSLLDVLISFSFGNVNPIIVFVVTFMTVIGICIGAVIIKERRETL